MTSVQALDMPPEMWIKIASYFRSDPIYHIGGCCGGPFRPSPGAGIVGPLPSSAPPKDMINLSCVCRILRSTFEGDIKTLLSLRIRHQDGRFTHQRGSNFLNNDEEKKNTAEIHELATLPLGDHILHLRLALRDYDFKALDTISQEYCDSAAPILYGTPRLQSLEISGRFSSCGNDFDLSPAFCRALSSLRDLRTIQLRGLSIPSDCPNLDNVEYIQTDAKIHSFKSLPRLRDLRQNPNMFAPGYNIPSDMLARLEVLHHCSPDNIDERVLLPQVCRVWMALLFTVTQTRADKNFELTGYEKRTH
jgi:hypothetical protein